MNKDELGLGKTEMFKKRLEKIFSTGMKLGYALGAEGDPVPSQPGEKILIFSKNNWSLTDRWTTNPKTGIFFGTTCIRINDISDWEMRYRGQHESTVIPILRQVLLAAYSRELFYGGRGEEFYTDAETGIEYRNKASGDILEFSGKETMGFDLDKPNAMILGYCEYRGGAMCRI